MRKTFLMTTVAAAAVVGMTAMAAAQGTLETKGAAKPAGAAEDHQKAAPSGATMHQPSGTATPAGQSAQGADQAAKPDQRLGQEQKTQTTPQQGAEDRSAAPPKGAQDEHGTQQRGAQEESGKSGAPTSEHAKQGGNSRGAAVQLSQDQRTKIQGIIGKSNNARVTANVNFNIAVGVTVPRSVHVEVLPEDVVEIVPQYEGYDYIVVGNEILIVDPDSLAIVAIIES
jgi:hypothetical protein